MRKSSIDDAALGDAGGAAGLEDVRSACPANAFGTQRRTGPPRSHSSSNSAELLEVVEALHFLERIELQLLLLLEPERAAGRFVKVMLDDFISMLIELVLGSLGAGFELSGRDDFGLHWSMGGFRVRGSAGQGRGR